MLKKILIHETLLNLTSFRFYLIVVLLAIMFFGGLFVNIGNYKTRLAEYNETIAANDSFHVAVPPNPLSVFAEGADQYSSMAVVMDDIQIGRLSVKSLGKSNVSLRMSAFSVLDFNFAVKVLLSLGAIFITFESISGERFSGILKLTCASGVPKRHIILGKILSSFLCLAIPFIIFTVISCLVLAANNMLATFADIIRVLLFTLFSLIYILFFLLAGLIISISTRRPQESLITGMMFWLLLTFILPALIPYASNLLAALPSPRAMEEARTQRWVATMFETVHSTDRELDARSRLDDMQAENESDWEKARNQFDYHAKTKRILDFLSPSDIYNNASTEIVGSGLQNALHARDAILRHKNNILKDPRSGFAFKRAAFVSDLIPAITSMLILCLVISVLMLVAYRQFMLLDLREG